MKHKIPPVIVFMFSIGLAWLVRIIFPQLSVDLPYNRFISITFLGVGFVIGFMGIVQFRKHKTTVDPTTPTRASAMVTTGIYKYSRNPMYLGMAFGLLAYNVLFTNLLSSISIIFFVWYITRYQIKPEEIALTKLFGRPYIAYQSAVRRWV